jgi:hypothetical protein
MAVDSNKTPLERPIRALDGVTAIEIRTIADAARFVRNLPSSADDIHWRLVGGVLKGVDEYPDDTDLMRTATLALEHALTTHGMLGREPYLDALVEAWEGRRKMLATQLEWLESGKMRTGTNIPDSTTKEDIARLRSWIAELDDLIADHSVSESKAQ